MSVSVSSIDPMSWVIHISHSRPNADFSDIWRRPQEFSGMREAIHEATHFWCSFTTHIGIELSFDCLKSMNALRFAARRGIDLTKIKSDFETDGYRPFLKFFAFQEIDPNSNHGLSCVHLYEGIARYWDTVLGCGIEDGNKFIERINSDNSIYHKAYLHAHQKVGEAAFFLFPTLAYLALSYKNPILWYETTLNNIAQNPVSVSNKADSDSWFNAFKALWNSNQMFGLPYGPLSTYNIEYKRYRRWKGVHAGEIREDWPLGGHPILDCYASNLSWLAQSKGHHSIQAKESCIFPEFALIGRKDFMEILITYFYPPFIVFSDGKNIINPPPLFQYDLNGFLKGMNRFSAFMGITYNLIAGQRNITFYNNCSQILCPVHGKSLCSGAVEYPDDYNNCILRQDMAREFGIR